MKTSLKDLNDYLFEELERLNDTEELKEEQNFEKELKRSNAIANIGSVIVKNASVVLNTLKIKNEYNLIKDKNINNLIEHNDNEIN